MKLFFKIVFVSILINTFASANELLQTSSKLIANGKNVILFFGTKTCPYCEVMKKDFVKDKELNAMLKKNFNIYYIPLDEYKEYEMGDKKLPKKTNTTSLKMGFAVKTTPQIIMFDKAWNKIFQLPGYADPSQLKIFIRFMEGLESGKYTIKDYRKYLKDEGMIK